MEGETVKEIMEEVIAGKETVKETVYHMGKLEKEQRGI